jgi:hypothetical protein
VSRGLKALAAVAVVVVAVVLGFRAVKGGDDTSGDQQSASAGSTGVPAPPAELPDVGTYVDSTVTRDGEIDVRTWIRSATPISELDVTTTDPDLAPGGTESLDVHVRTFAGKTLARRESVGTNPQKIRLREPSTELYLTYTVDGGMSDASETVQGRSLARVLAMDLSWAGATGPVVRRVAGPGTVTNVACITVKDDEDFDATPRPCGAATDDGAWLVTLTGAQRTDRLLASLQA